MKKQAGFTLVEIAIVMVIIGLLLGGVLKGREIITNAKIKNLENDYQGVTAAIYSYQDRYRALPGDDSRATTRFAGNTAVKNGDGNGKIDNTNSRVDPFSATADVEPRKFWLHLRNAGLVAGAADDQQPPLNAFGGLTGVTSGGANIPGLVVGFSNIPQNIANILESQQDDGKSATGNIQGVMSSDGTTDAASYTDTKLLYNLYFSL